MRADGGQPGTNPDKKKNNNLKCLTGYPLVTEQTQSYIKLRVLVPCPRELDPSALFQADFPAAPNVAPVSIEQQKDPGEENNRPEE